MDGQAGRQTLAKSEAEGGWRAHIAQYTHNKAQYTRNEPQCTHIIIWTAATRLEHCNPQVATANSRGSRVKEERDKANRVCRYGGITRQCGEQHCLDQGGPGACLEEVNLEQLLSNRRAICGAIAMELPSPKKRLCVPHYVVAVVAIGGRSPFCVCGNSCGYERVKGRRQSAVEWMSTHS